MIKRAKLIATTAALSVLATGTAAWAVIHEWVTVRSDLVSVGTGPELQDLQVDTPTILYQTEAATLYPRQSAGIQFRVVNRNAIPMRITRIVTEGATSVVPACREQLRFFGQVASAEHPVDVPAASITGSAISGSSYVTLRDVITITGDGYAACKGHTFRTVWKVSGEPI